MPFKRHVDSRAFEINETRTYFSVSVHRHHSLRTALNLMGFFPSENFMQKSISDDHTFHLAVFKCTVTESHGWFPWFLKALRVKVCP